MPVSAWRISRAEELLSKCRTLGLACCVDVLEAPAAISAAQAISMDLRASSSQDDCIRIDSATGAVPRVVEDCIYGLEAARSRWSLFSPRAITMVIGLELPNGCFLAHGQQELNIKRPFADLIPKLEMHELSAGNALNAKKPTNLATSFSGQLGYIPFTTTHRLPRHVHIAESPDNPDETILVTERILVVGGIALVQLNSKVYIIPPGTLVTIAPGVPHTWNACPAGVQLPDGAASHGTFLMVYEYEVPTGFFPTAQTDTVQNVAQYERFQGDLEQIRFPDLSAKEVVEQAALVWGTELRRAELADIVPG